MPVLAGDRGYFRSGAAQLLVLAGNRATFVNAEPARSKPRGAAIQLNGDGDVRHRVRHSSMRRRVQADLAFGRRCGRGRIDKNKARNQYQEWQRNEKGSAGEWPLCNRRHRTKSISGFIGEIRSDRFPLSDGNQLLAIRLLNSRVGSVLV
jgi:hypothetical protein